MRKLEYARKSGLKHGCLELSNSWVVSISLLGFVATLASMMLILSFYLSASIFILLEIY